MKFVKMQQKTYLENVISDADYRFFVRKLKSYNVAVFFEEENINTLQMLAVFT